MPISSGNMPGYAWAFQSKTEKEKQALIELRAHGRKLPPHMAALDGVMLGKYVQPRYSS